MKNHLVLILSVLCVMNLQAQDIATLQRATSNPQNKIQAIHHYPENVKNGECHYVQVVSVTVDNNNVTIVETWSNWLGAKATTTLTGTLAQNVVTGTWKSNYSSGDWSYDFSRNTGRWNKTNSSFDRFDSWQPLEITIGSKVKDGFYTCN